VGGFLNIRDSKVPLLFYYSGFIMSLWNIFFNHTGRLIHKCKHYIPVYERYFESYINKPVLIFEIGCGHGGSVQMWKSYFGPYATIVGIDINPKCKVFEEDQILVRIGSQDNKKFLKSLIDEFGSPDIIIDDGSHFMKHVTTSFEYLYPYVSKNGIYLVEDMYFAYNKKMGGGFNNKGSFIEYSKNLVDLIHARYIEEVSVNSFTESTMSISFYDSIIVFEKGLHLPSVDMHRGVHKT